jgi:uncharacterized protein (DUF1800 family)
MSNRPERCASARRRWSRAAVPFALAAAVLLPDAARGAEGTQVFSVDVLLAPVAVDGSFQLTIADAGVQGTLQVDTDARGKLAGTLTVGVQTFAVKGAVTHGRKGTRAHFTATSGADRITFQGALSGSTLVGDAVGKGAVAPGRNEFTLNLATASPGVARLECAVVEAASGRFSGSAHVIACGETLDLVVSGRRTAKRWSLTLKAGRSFRFSGGGPPAEDQVVGWSAKGFGATASGTGLLLDVLAPPDAPAYAVSFAEFETDAAVTPVVPTSPPLTRGAWSVAPELPAGLTISAADGTIAGLPTEIRETASYTVTATNFAGSAETSLQIRTRVPRARSFAAETRTLTDDDLRHFLARTQFGVTQVQLDRVRTMGIEAYVDDMLVFSQSGPAEAIARPELLNASDPPGLEGMYPSATQLGRWWSSLMVNTDNPFQERLAFFWHDLFSASSDIAADAGQTHFVVDYVNLFRYQGHGDLRPLLVGMARDPLMLLYLDGYRNTRTAPNENFAREFWELFTLGVDNGYTQDDIVQAARAFTGYRMSIDAQTGLASMVFDPSRHDTGNKVFFGRTIQGQNAADDYQAVVDVTLEERAVAEFVTKKLFEHFGYANPPQDLVDAMATNLRASDYDVAEFLRALFKSEAFFSTSARRNLVKSPVDFAVGFIQTTGLKLTVSSLTTQLTTLAQVPTQPPSVNGWPVGDMWLSAQNMTDRMNAVYLCVEDTTRQMSQNPQINVANVLPPVAERTPENVVDTLASLLRIDLTSAERQRCVDFLNTAVTGSAATPTTTGSPFDGSSQSHLDTRVRSLLYILAQHPSYQVR